MHQQGRSWAVGWSAFAGIMMVILGGWWIVSSFAAIIKDEFFVVAQDWIYKFDVTTWSWIHLLLGIVILGAGFAVFSGAVWARTVGVIVAVIAGLVASLMDALVSGVGNPLRRRFRRRGLGAHGTR